MKEFTAKEFEFLSDREFLLAKHTIHEKVVTVLGQVEASLRGVVGETPFSFPPGVLLKAGKISRGENYRGLPYWVLDYPRKFQKEETFACRTMIWWGHEISCTLHLSGPSVKFFDVSQLEEYYFCVGKSPWEYHFEKDNYLPLSQISLQTIREHVEEFGFIKVACKWPLTALVRLPGLASDYFRELLISLSENE